jgi:hypothetical protein
MSVENWWHRIRSALRRILVDDVDLYVTLLASALLVGWSVLGDVTADQIAAATLTVLALLCIVLLRNRRHDAHLRDALDHLTGTGAQAGRFFSSQVDDLDEVRSRIHGSREIWMLGTTLGIHLPALAADLRAAVEKGLYVKILLVRPDSKAMEMAAFRSGVMTTEQLSQTMLSNLRVLLLSTPASIRGSLEVRVVDYLAPYTLYAYDPDGAKGVLDIRLPNFRGSHWVRPTFRVSRERDGDWFEHFRAQFADLWEAGEPYGELQARDSASTTVDLR